MMRRTGRRTAGLHNWLDRWSLGESGALECEFTFRGYRDAIRFVNLVAVEAEGQDHHPEMTVGYDKVRVSLITHDIGMVSVKDHRLGEAITRIYLDMEE
jgi:4a-hydroxytetrahydrobiopterin dehydratase